MNPSRAKLVTLSAAGAAIVVLFAAIMAAKDRILERYYIHQLEQAIEGRDGQMFEKAVTNLGHVGSEAALIELQKPDWWDWPRAGLDWPRSDRWRSMHFASCEIIARIGERRAHVFITSYVKNTSQDEINRVRLARLPFWANLNIHQTRETIEAKIAAIAAWTDLLDSENLEVAKDASGSLRSQIQSSRHEAITCSNEYDKEQLKKDARWLIEHIRASR